MDFGFYIGDLLINMLAQMLHDQVEEEEEDENNAHS